ncbi:DUF551 domain-containing protein [Escherichia coli]|nr:DUF551 domain-containing protein [Escherichia coli]
MTTFTKEQLISHARESVSYLENLKGRVSKEGADCKVVLEMVERDLELARIALASLEAKPIGAFHIAEQQVDGTSDYLKDGEWPIDNGIIEVYAAPPVPVVPAALPENDDEDGHDIDYLEPSEVYALGRTAGWNACRAAMLHAGNFREIPETSTNSPVTPTLLPGGFTVEDAKELHENLVRSHISQALSGEKMKKKDRDADLRWIHGVIVQAAWFVKASLEQNALSGNSPVTPDGWISCSDRMPEDTKMLLAFSQGKIVAAYWNWVVNPIDYKKYRAFTYLSGYILDDVTHWMPLP